MQVQIENYRDIGHYLREVRESTGLDVRNVAHHLNIRAKYLLALENGDLGEIPGKVYARGYLQNYAEYLGLDKDEIAEEFDRLVENRKEVKYFLPEPTERGYQPGMLVVGASLLLVVLIYIYWYGTHQDRLAQPTEEMVAPVPERLINPWAEEEVEEEAEPSDLIGPMPETPLDESATPPAEEGSESSEDAGAETGRDGAALQQRRDKLPWLEASE